MHWWTNAVGYEVYIRSFADGNGDGIGDFAGLIERLDHLAWLGVDVVWVTPFYPSPQADFGYDVMDYTDIDPQFGDLDTFDRLVERARQLGLRVMIDIVPNHTSDRHPWFLQALADPTSPYRDYYIFRPPGPDGGPPNNWISNFGGPAWTLDPASGEYYCHLFLPQQPDLNWASEAVRAEFDRILTFWMERGVDGFRIDVAHALMKHPSFADNPQIEPLPANPTPRQAYKAFDHLYDQDQPTNRDIYRRWKSLPGGSEICLLGEVYLTDAERSAAYMNVGGLDWALFFALNRRPWDPVAFADEIRHWVRAAPTGFAWSIASHDEHRPATRFGGGDEGLSRAIALWTALAMLPGMPFLYQGEELGLENGYVDPADVQDPVGMEAHHEGRDPCRTPMPWEPGPGQGFTTAERAWLRCALRPPGDTVAVQREDPGSTLNLYRRFLQLRRRQEVGSLGPAEWLEAGPGVVAFRRRDLTVVANLTDSGVEVDLDPATTLIFDTGIKEDTDEAAVPPRTTRIYTR